MKKRTCVSAFAAGTLVLAGVLGWYISPGVTVSRLYESLNGKPRPEDPAHTLQTISVPWRNTYRVVTAQQARGIRDGVLLFAFPTCPYCRNLMPILTDIATESKIPVAYCPIDRYRDVYEYDEAAGGPVLSSPSGPGYHELLDWLQDYLPEYELYVGDNAYPVGEKRIGVPLLLTIRDGEPVSSWQLDDVETDFPDDKYLVWNEETGSRVRASLASYLAGD